MSVGSFNPEKEVKKLQELVKKLEQQNEILRTQQFDEKVESPGPQNGGKEIPSQSAESNVSSHQSSDSSDEIVECESSSLAEEESWLLQLTKKPSSQQMTQSPVQWMREHFDNPSSGLTSSKRLLLHKLDEFRLIEKSGPNENAEESSHESGVKDNHQVPQLKQPALVDMPARIDSGTFARTRKNERFSKSVSPFSLRVDDASTKSHPQFFDREDPLTDLTDVRVIARLQEESLKQQVHNLSHRSRTGSQASVNSSSGSLEEISGDSPTSVQDKYKTFTRRKHTPTKTPSPTSSMAYRGQGPQSLLISSTNHEDRSMNSKNFDGSSQSKLPQTKSSSRRPHSTGIPRPSMLPRPGRPK